MFGSNLDLPAIPPVEKQKNSKPGNIIFFTRNDTPINSEALNWLHTLVPRLHEMSLGRNCYVLYFSNVTTVLQRAVHMLLQEYKGISRWGKLASEPQ